MSKSRLRYLFICLLLVGVAALSLLPRVFSLDAHWSSDESLWLSRSRHFILSIRHADVQGTLQSYHPGVTTMWLAGGRLWTAYGETLSEAPTDEKYGFLSPSNLARCRFMIALTTSGILLIAFLLIRRLFGTKIAMLAALFLALDPIYLAQSRRLHTDALFSGFLLLSILKVLIFAQDFKQVRYLILSGICLGIAGLSKSNALIAVFYFPLLMLCFPHSNFAVWGGRSVCSGLIWGGTACLTFMMGWPAIFAYGIQIQGIWIPTAGITMLGLLGGTIYGVGTFKRFVGQQIETTAEAWQTLRSVLIGSGVCFGVTAIGVYSAVAPVLERIGWALTTKHEVQHLFLGKIVKDPGALFYPLMLSIQSAPLTLPLAFIGFIYLWRQRHHPQYARTYQIYVALTAFLILFAFCMSMGAKKMSRYLLPVFPVLDILAAVAGHVLVEKICQRDFLKRLSLPKFLNTQNLSVLTTGLIVVIQVMPVLNLYPHYGTYYNPCWQLTDITKIRSIGGAYGLDRAADYLNQKPDAQDLTVRVSPLSERFFSHYFRGKSYPSGTDSAESLPDYEVAYIRDVQIKRVHLASIRGTLEHIIRLNGIDYVWIYKLAKN